MLRPKLHSDPLMIPMREVSGMLPGCETRSTFQPRWITLQREAVVAPAVRIKFDEVHPLVRIHHLRRKGEREEGGGLRLVTWHQETRAASPCLHADRPRRPLLGAIFPSPQQRSPLPFTRAERPRKVHSPALHRGEPNVPPFVASPMRGLA